MLPRVWFSFLFLIASAAPAAARSGPLSETLPADRWLTALRHDMAAQSCRTAARSSESRLGLPPGILLAIGRVESARLDAQTRRLEPWPWTVQAMGEGLYFETKADAIQWVEQARAKGIMSIDAGCLQVNLLSHPHAFGTLEDAFDPQRNADYAGQFLRQLYRETGDWRLATGLYHSRTSSIAAPYQTKVANALRDADQTLLSPGQSRIVGMLAKAWQSTLPVASTARAQTLAAWSVLLPTPPGSLAQHRLLTGNK